MYLLLLVVIFSYLAGSIPTAVITGRILIKDDIRNLGSRNAGATNIFRVMGWKPALFVVLIDIGKGVAAVLLISRIAISLPMDFTIVKILAGFSAILGHIWTVFGGFRGGKGVGTAFGVLVSLAPTASLISFVIWLIIVLSVRIVSAGSLCAGIVFPVVLFIQKYYFNIEISNSILILGVVITVLVFITHRSNIKRLLRREENRFNLMGKNKK